MIGCVKIEQIMNVSVEGKRYLRSMEDKGIIKITREIFHIRHPKINLINIGVPD